MKINKEIKVKKEFLGLRPGDTLSFKDGEWLYTEHGVDVDKDVTNSYNTLITLSQEIVENNLGEYFDYSIYDESLEKEDQKNQDVLDVLVVKLSELLCEADKIYEEVMELKEKSNE